MRLNCAVVIPVCIVFLLFGTVIGWFTGYWVRKDSIIYETEPTSTEYHRSASIAVRKHMGGFLVVAKIYQANRRLELLSTILGAGYDTFTDAKYSLRSVTIDEERSVLTVKLENHFFEIGFAQCSEQDTTSNQSIDQPRH